ncbi:Calx-beta domain-containing protein [Pseudomonas sp.]|uniref:Calx-beta domain-containing protein n=1 Tax=Pseudomonas sp. TaxID=306 RepID=UPI002588E030|nr:Calx-beta domain-containing protein [Pseudomonas sp.]
MPDFVGASRAIFTVSLTKAATEPVSVDWATRDGTAIAARDYVLNSGTVTFLPGELSRTFEVLVMGRTVETEDRVFFIDFTPPSNAILRDQSAACIIHVDHDGTQPLLAVVYPKGERGLSAYEVGLQNGFVGTESEWLMSLVDLQALAPLVAARIDIQVLAQAVAPLTTAALAARAKRYYLATGAQ